MGGARGLENVSWTYLTCKGGWPLSAVAIELII